MSARTQKRGCPMQLMTAVVLCGVITLGGTHPDLSGRWTFNAAQSDNPRDMLQGRDSTGDQPRGRGGAYPSMGGGRGGFWCGGGGGVWPGGGGGGRGGGGGGDRRSR